MRITDVKVKLAHGDEKLLAFASVTFDHCFVVRDIKIIQGASGLFVAMPSRKITDRCTACGAKNLLQSRFCGHCGARLQERRGPVDARGRSKFHADIAHPINSRYRGEMQDAILKCYQSETALSRQPGYVAPNLDDVDAGPEDDLETAAESASENQAEQTARLATPPSPQATATAGDAQGETQPPQQTKSDGAGLGIFG
jgi:stage V sporulation protein G